MARGDLKKRALKAANEKRSPLFTWMRNRHAEIAETVEIRGGWMVLKDAATEDGIEIIIRRKSDDGQIAEVRRPPTIAALHSAWLRVQADLGRAPTVKQAKPKPATRTTAPPPPNPSPDTTSPKTGTDDIRAKLGRSGMPMPDPLKR